MKKVLVLDSSALIAQLNDEQGAEIVEQIFLSAQQESNTILIHAASIAEVYYDFLKRADLTLAEQFLKDVNQLPLKVVTEISFDLIKAMGHFKTKYKISFADIFVLATAKLNNAAIITSDHHEFDIIEVSGELTFEWIR